MSAPRINGFLVAARKAAVEAWIGVATAGDAALGRGDAQWDVPPALAIKGRLADLKARGVTAYAGSGQLLLVDYRPLAPAVIQRRPLAQRRVAIHIPEGEE